MSNYRKHGIDTDIIIPVMALQPNSVLIVTKPISPQLILFCYSTATLCHLVIVFFNSIFTEIRKVLVDVASRKGYEALEGWIQPCLNHLHWSATSTPDGNGKIILAKFHSFLQHIVNNHTDLQDPLFNKCQHSEKITKRKWLDKGKQNIIILTHY